MRKLGLVLTAALLVSTFSISTDVLAAEDSVAAFYKGKRVKMIIGFSVGGGYDTYGRLLARHMGKHIPGNPRIVAQNMTGAGSMKFTNYLYKEARADGTVFGAGIRDFVMLYALNPDEYEFDPTKFSWIGSMNKELSVCVSWHDSPIQQFKDMLTQEFIVAETGSGGGQQAYYPLMINLFGAKLKHITGYSGGSEMSLALERGEVDGRCTISWTTLVNRNKSWLDEGKINILLQLGLEKHPDLPDVPLILDLTDDPEERKVIEFIFSVNLMGRPILAPPGVPTERLEALRRAFQATLVDPEFLAEAEKMRLEIQIMTGEALQNLVTSLVATPPDILEFIRKTLKISSKDTAVKPGQ